MKLKLTPQFIAFVIFDIALVVVLAILVWPEPDPGENTQLDRPKAAPTRELPRETKSAPDGTATLMPINNVDPLTGKPVAYGCPVVQYKGHIIGFCCKQSPAFNGGWDRMSEVEKDAFVARYAG